MYRLTGMGAASDRAIGVGSDDHDPRADLVSELTASVPRLSLEWGARAGDDVRHLALHGSLLFADITGFTTLSERLAAFGRVGAEEVSDLVDLVFRRLSRVAYDAGGSLLKFGGDAILLLFEGPDHERRTVASATGMRRALRELGDLESRAGRIRLEMSQGIHSGDIDTFLVGSSHRELVITGPVVTMLTELEEQATAGQILVSGATAAALPDGLLGEPRGAGHLLIGHPRSVPPPHASAPTVIDPDPSGYLPTAVRQHLIAGGTRAEHRQALVGFVAFSGTDAILRERGADACAEALHVLVAAAQEAADEHRIALLGSDIAANGGKLILVAGAPVAHPDDADRLLRVARTIVTARVPLEVRVGIHRGPLFAGLIGPSYRSSYTVMGDTVNLAARLAGRAGPSEVLASAETVERTRSRFATDHVEPFLVKGKRDPIEAMIVGPLQGVRVEQRPQLPLIGRDRELESLEEELRASAEGTGRVVELVGPPGIGKSRLVHELRGRHPDLRLYYASCDPYEAATPYFAFRDLLSFLLGLESRAEDELRAAVAAVDPDLLPWLPLIGSVVDVPTSRSAVVDALDPQFRQSRLVEIAGRLLAGLLPYRAILRIEDIHWMDNASRLLMEHLTRSVVPGRAWLLIVTSREALLGEIAHRRLQLDPLVPEAIRAFAQTAVAEGFVSLELASALAAKAHGNPLFLEELLTHGGDRDEEVPDSVEHLIAARLDRLRPDQRDLLRHAALIGKRFEVDLLRSVTGLEIRESALEVLAEFVRREPDGSYVFEHDLFRDVAYAGMPYRRRRELHDRVGRIIETRLTGRTEEAAELLALHYHRAERHDKAWEYTRVAARRADERAAPDAAVRFLRWALDAAARMDAVDEDELLAAWTELGDHLEILGAYEEAEEAYSKARRLADVHQRPSLWYRSGVIREREGRYTQALRWYGRAANLLADDQGPSDPALLARVRLRRAEVHLHQGRILRAQQGVRDLLPLVEDLGDPEVQARAHFVLGWALRTHPEGDTHRREALALYEHLHDLGGQALVHIDLGVAAYYRGEWNRAVEHYERARDLKERIGDSVAAAISISNVGEIRSDQGRLREADDAFTHALLVFRAAGFAIGSGVATGNLGRAASRQGDFVRAASQLDEARGIFREIRSAAFEAEMRARQAELLVFSGRPDEAVQHVRELITDLEDHEGSSPTLALAERALGVALARSGDLEAAVDTLTSAREHADAIYAAYDVALTDVALGWTLERTDPDRAAVHTDAAARTLESLEVTVPPLSLVLGPDAVT